MAASGNLKTQLAEAFAGDVAASVEIGTYLDALQSVFAVTAGNSVTSGTVASSANLANIQGRALFAPAEYFGTTASSTYVTNVPFANGSCYFSYAGRSPKYATTCQIQGIVGNTGTGTHTWTEIGVVAAALSAGTTSAITAVLGFVSMTAEATAANSGAVFTKTVTLTGCHPGQDLWIYYGSTANTTGWIPKGCLSGDAFQSGRFQTAATRPSILTAASLPLAMGQCAAASAPPDLLLFF